jgi:hypothetical protein
MALTYDDLTSKTNKFIVPRMVDEVYKSSPLFTRLRTRNMERFEGGQTIRHPIMYAKLKGGAFTRGGSFDTSYVQTDTALEVNKLHVHFKPAVITWKTLQIACN